MIICNLVGGLGNMMFQIASMKSFALDNGVEAVFPNLQNQINNINNDSYHNPSLKHADDYLSVFSNLGLVTRDCNAKKIVNVPFFHIPLKYKEDTEYVGYFQSEKFFKHNQDFILDLFRPSIDIASCVSGLYKDYINLNTCAIHVRRGDYLKLQHLHPVQDINYFERAINEIGNVDKYLVFSDDIEWCKSNFIGDKFVFIEGNKDYIDLFLISECNNQIISNSSFSWWGAWLNKNKDKKIVAPINWFNKSTSAYESSGATDIDIVPDSWIKV